MNGDIRLSIPTPCSENWSKFEHNEDGGYCHSCNKVVKDFTGLTENEIYGYFRQVQTTTCGRFRKDQIRIYSSSDLPNIKTGYGLFKASVLAIVLLLLSNREAKSQSLVHRTQQEQAVGQLEKTNIQKNTGNGATVTGKVTYEGEILPGVNVGVRGKNISTVVDWDGNYELKNLEQGDVLEFFFLGFESMTYTVLPIAASEEANIQVANIEFSESELIFMGEVNVTSVYESKDSPLKRIANKLVNIF